MQPTYLLTEMNMKRKIAFDVNAMNNKSEQPEGSEKPIKTGMRQTYATCEQT